MLVRYHQHRLEWQAAKWIVLIALASALALVWATTIAGGAEISPQESALRRLPAEIEEWSAPMPPQIEMTDALLVEGVWEALDCRQTRQFERTIALWNQLQLPPQAEVWKQLAIAESYLQIGDHAAADASLSRAISLQPENPLGHYIMGRLRLEQSLHADEWYDAARSPLEMLLTAYHAKADAPKTKSLCRLEALMELEEAVRLSADDLWFDDSLLPIGIDCNEILPTAYDLLRAIEATGYVATSHQLLGDLNLEMGALETAEEHLDQAVAGGLSVSSYQELAERFEERGQYADAFRVYLKASQQAPAKLEQLRNAWRTLRDSFL